MITPVVYKADKNSEKPDYGMCAFENHEIRDINFLNQMYFMVFNKLESLEFGCGYRKAPAFKRDDAGESEDLLEMTEPESEGDFKV